MTEEAASILVVDDEQSITDFVSYSLMKEGFKVDVANNGEDALEQATRKHYDLFVLDIMLPGMDGYELCRRLRSRTTAPVLFLSAAQTPSSTRSSASKSAVTITWPSPSACASSSPAFAPCFAAAPLRHPIAARSWLPESRSTKTDTRPSAPMAPSI